jgi:hypothetical protein
MAELPPELKKLEKEFLDMKSEASDFLGKMSDTQFNKRPADNGWSVAECIDHLIATGADYCDKIDEAIQKLRDKNKLYTGEMKHGFFGGKFIGNVEPPVKRKFKSPAKWRPDSKINKAKATEAYLQLQDRWIDLIHKSQGLDLTKISLPSPAVSWIRFRAFDTFGINSAHQRRHMWQAKNVKKNIK